MLLLAAANVVVAVYRIRLPCRFDDVRNVCLDYVSVSIRLLYR